MGARRGGAGDRSNGLVRRRRASEWRDAGHASRDLHADGDRDIHGRNDHAEARHKTDLEGELKTRETGDSNRR